MTVRTATDADRAAIAALASAALDLDSAEAPALTARLAAPPPGRVWTALLAGEDGVAYASLSQADPSIGHIDLLAVHPRARGRGLGKELVRAAEDWLRGNGAAQVRMAGNPPCYAWPGIDVRATPAACLAESLGYERYHTAFNMTADLTGDLGVSDDLDRLAKSGVTVYSAPPSDRDRVAAFGRKHWNDNWAWEIEYATGCHYAVRAGEVIGFAAWGTRPEWFGPMGTAEEARGLGVGGVLLRRCLAEQRDRGHATAQISWVGPMRFYARTVGARVERVFWLYRRDLR
ncbi:GNAT family N-acetyltransferase [Spongiactinospora rosea]|uniref:GNAT family N-acetyltransferase n=1 Tax=Spongiactinospora rosea TaxID=2248750 RepID=A0A366LP71_9ACTN|nr:GNAT family N-acetyltransferase [Spongiactinospora rosea]RBQ15313.1 GNAT family N-acetyltransferase [Spongiactinospora rosea]